MHWSDGHVTGILDWDLASASDRSTDLATLGVWHGWDVLDRIADPRQVARATVRRNTVKLQQVAFLVVSGRLEPRSRPAWRARPSGSCAA